MDELKKTMAEAGDRFLAWLPGAAWKGLGILAAVLVAWILYMVIKKSITGIIRRLNAARAIPTSERKLNTIRNLSLLLVKILIVFFAVVAIFSILDLTGVLTSIVATAGVGGLLVVFGAQSIVKDLIAGLLLAMEDQITLGDFVEVNGITGTVEGLTIRTVQIRGPKGELHTLQAGSITMVTNYSRGDMNAVVDISIPYEAHIPTAVNVLQDEANRWAADHQDIVRSEPQVLGVVSLNDSGVAIRIVCRVTGKFNNYAAERQLRALLKERLEREGMSVPYPHVTVVPKEEG